MQFEPRVIMVEDNTHIVSLVAVFLKTQDIAHNLARLAEQGKQFV